ncbi:MAG: flavodoxin reductase [Pseudomonadota bacterium]
MRQKLEIKSIRDMAANVREVTVDRPEGYEFEPGQATLVCLCKDGWCNESRPFSFTSAPTWRTLTFAIKIYPEHHGVTAQIGRSRPGDWIEIGEAFGTICYLGPGTFIAGGTGITPFISIVRMLREHSSLDGHQLLFASRREKDIIACSELYEAFGASATFAITAEASSIFEPRPIRETLAWRNVQPSLTDRIYLCGPTSMVEELNGELRSAGFAEDQIVKEEWDVAYQ